MSLQFNHFQLRAVRHVRRDRKEILPLMVTGNPQYIKQKSHTMQLALLMIRQIFPRDFRNNFEAPIFHRI